jgi:hypothetical protein
VQSGALPTTLNASAVLNKVDGTTGATTGVDGDGVALGQVASANPPSVAVSAAVVNPKIKAKITSAHAKTKYGWYRSKVTVTYTCVEGSATVHCPTVTHFSKTGKHTVTKSITAADGGKASITVKVNLDLGKPKVTVTGAKKGHTYAAKRKLKAHCSDAKSGVASCKVKQTKSGHTYHWVATVKDKAGNVATKKGSYKIKK